MIGCDCSVDVDECAKVSHARVRTARKRRWCIECDGAIQPGQQYEYYSVLDDRWEHYSTCLPCARIREHYCLAGWIFGFVAEQILKCLGFDYRKVPGADEADEIDRLDAERVERERKRRA